MQRRLTLLLVVGALVVIGLLPLGMMLGKSLFVDDSLTFAVYEKLFADTREHWAPLGHSLTLACLTAGLAMMLGVPLGLVLGKTNLPFRRLLAVLLSIPLLVPPYILAVSWSNLLARDGLLARVIPMEIVELMSGWLLGFPGCAWVLVSAFMPVVMILTMVYLHALSPRLEEAGRLSARWPGILRTITLPIIMPGILFGGILVFLLALGEVGVPMFLRYPVFPVETLTQFSAFYDFGAAAAAATPMLGIALAALALERFWLREKTYRLRPITSGTRMLLVSLGRWCVPTLLAVGLLAAATVALPLLALVKSSLSPFAYYEAWDKAAESLGRSLVFAFLGASLLTMFGFFCGYLIHHRAVRFWRSVDTLTLLLFTLPGTVIGVGLIALWNRPMTNFVYASAAMVLLAYLAQYTALTSRIMLATLVNVPQSLEEAAQMSGAPWFARILHVVVPAALPGVIAAWLIGFIFCLRDLGASMLVYPPGQDTLPVRIYTLMANGAPNLIAALCVIMVSVTLISLAILGSVFRATVKRK
ncbi:MAG: iron ABC transporter permease [Betaproteobacteria bacterium]